MTRENCKRIYILKLKDMYIYGRRNIHLYTLKNKSVLDAFKSDLDAFEKNKSVLDAFDKTEKRLRRF